MAALLSGPIVCHKSASQTAKIKLKVHCVLGLPNVALTNFGKVGLSKSDAFRSAEHLARDAQSADLA